MILPLIPIAQSDAELLRYIKEPGFAQFVIYLVVLVLVVDRVQGMIQRRKATQITGSIEMQEATAFAKEKDLQALRQEVQDLKEGGQARHDEAKRAAEKRVTDITKAFDEDTQKIVTKVEAGFDKVTEKLSDVGQKVAAQEATLKAVDKRIDDLNTRYRDSIGKLHERVHDAMQAAAEARASKGGK